MTTVVQTTYRPQIPFGLVGLPADGMPHGDASRVVETAAGIGFGLCVSQGVRDVGCILGGSNLLGITIRDVTLTRSPIDPLAAVSPIPTVDIYPQWSNCAIRSQGHIWVMAGADNNAGDPLFYSTTTGQLTNAAGGIAATGSITFASQPNVGDTITLDGTVWSFIAAGTTGTATQVPLGPMLGDTVNNLQKALNASADVNTVLMKYAMNPPTPVGGGSGANQLLIASVALGVAGNAYTLASSSANATLSGATLSGGSATAVSVPSGYWLSAAIAGQLAKVALGIQR